MPDKLKQGKGSGLSGGDAGQTETWKDILCEKTGPHNNLPSKSIGELSKLWYAIGKV